MNLRCQLLGHDLWAKDLTIISEERPCVCLYGSSNYKIKQMKKYTVTLCRCSRCGKYIEIDSYLA